MTRKQPCNLAMALFLFIGTASSVQAVPAAYDESIVGELGPGAVFMALDVGVNTIRGRIHLTETNDINHPDTDFDGFRAYLPNSARLTGVSYAFVLSERTTAVTFAGVDVNMDIDSAWVLAGNGHRIDLLHDTTPVNLFGASMPTAHTPGGSFGFAEIALCCRAGPGYSWTADYTWTLTVERTPTDLPLLSTSTLIGLGVAGLTLRKRNLT